MNFENYISRKLLKSSSMNFSKPIINLSVVSIATGLAVMIIALSIVIGFQRSIKDKLIGFGSHIQITGYEINASYESSPIKKQQSFITTFNNLDDIKHIQSFAHKAGIVKTNFQIEGVVLKGVDSDFDWSYFEQTMVDGRIFMVNDSIRSNEVIISQHLSDRMLLRTGDPLFMYFVNNETMQPRGRKFSIAGIYKTDFSEFDNIFIIGDIKHILKLNSWEDDQIGGFEIIIEDYSKLEEVGELIRSIAGYNLKTRTINQVYPQIFEWLKLHDINVFIIVGLLILLSGITMISTLLILILERSNFIGILKSLGASNMSIRKIFIYHVIYITGKGMLWGNFIGIGLCMIQKYFGLLKLDPESYYVNVVPVDFSIYLFVLINISAFIITALMILIPSMLISKISPVKVLRYS